MGRPTMWRRVSSLPPVNFFKPAQVPTSLLQEICLSVEEAEAIRLKDLQGLEQEECGNKMKISRTTFARILNSARQKVADALLNGKAIRIEGGNFQVALRRFRCATGHEWEVPFDTMTALPPNSCPECNITDILPVSPGRLISNRQPRGRRHRRGRW